MIEPDVEAIMMAHLDSIGYTDTAVPELPWDDIYPLILLNALPASNLDDEALTYMALVAILVVGETRESAWAARRAVNEAVLNDGLPYEVELDGQTWLVEPTKTAAGSALEPDINPDNRFIEASFWVPISMRF